MSAKIDFEKNLSKLELLVKELEQGELNLGDSLKKFEDGIKLYKSCKKSLGDAEKKVKVLMDSLKEEEL